MTEEPEKERDDIPAAGDQDNAPDDSDAEERIEVETFAAQMAAAERVMQEDQDALRELAN